jgi:lipopolysaccharide/colanic/teichoic acid biosynthesis glycosyltransferase
MREKCMGKSLFDFFLASVSVIILFPFLALVGILIKFDAPGPIFYRGVRSGKNGKTFKIFKFRTMQEDAENTGGPSTAQNDPRLTKLGKILRKYKIDEFPQLLNILKNEMSFVGPRPQVEKYTQLYKNDENLILTVKPGLTDFASLEFINLDQILGDKDVDEKYLREIEPAKNKLRLKYVQEKSFLTDMKILFLTIIYMSKIKKIWNTKN